MEIERIGFFHFGKDHDSPRLFAGRDRETGLRSGFADCASEGFNVRKFYKDKGECNYDPEVLRELVSLAKKCGAAFVAGLIPEYGNEPCYSSAYLIDGDGERLLCRKMVSDGYGDYAGCTRAASRSGQSDLLR